MDARVLPSRLTRPSSTPAERRLWRHLRAHRLAGCAFTRQYPLGPYIVDFACLERGLVIEVDGMSHRHKDEYDWIRSRYLRNRGLRVLRFSNDRVLLDTRAVLRSIERHLSVPKL